MSETRGHLARLGGAVLLASLAVLLLTVTATEPGGAQDGGSGPEVDEALRERLAGLAPGEVARAILVYDSPPTAAQVSAVEAAGVSVHTFDELPMLAVRGTEAQLREVLRLDALVSAYADGRLEYLLDESVPLIGAERVHDELGYTGEGVGVAIIDSGVDGTHGDVRYPERTVQNVKVLGDNIFTGQTVVLEDVPNTDTTSGHGTHVAGIVGGDGSMSGGRYAGVAPGADLVSIGAGDALFILYALEAFDYALANQERYNIEVISNSWGTTGEYDPNDPINVASREAYERGITVAFAAGNEGPAEDTLNPYSVAPWVIGVAAGEKDGRTLAEFSSRGRPGSDLYHPTLTAPGVDIVSTRASTGATINALAAADDVTNIPPGYLPHYTTASGTSMATPHVSGTVALMLEADPGLTPDEIKDILVRTADPMPYEEYEAGAGYLDAYEAVTVAAGAAQTAAATN